MTSQANNKNTRREELDVLIVGAGISGIGMCYQLQKERSHTSFAVIEGRKNIGGTWDLFKYPGIRSDSDMYTFAYSFKPWTDREYIATGKRIKKYLNDLVEDEGLHHYIRFEQRVKSANWDSTENRWRVTITRSDGSEYHIAAKFFTCCSGYYNYEKGYLPDFKGYADFRGHIAHPQHWPDDLDYSGKNVLVIGSGATAVTVVPAMAKKAAKVTMVQRSPSYIYSRPSSDLLYRIISRLLPKGLVHRIMRLKYTSMQQLAYVVSKKYPDFVRQLVRSANRKSLEGATDVDVHFKPNYKPWDQRMALVPNDDLFHSVRSGKTELVTDHIAHFTATGVQMKSGRHIEADIIVPATGLDLQLWGNIDLRVDGYPVVGRKLTNYKGMMFSQLPNFVWVFGYTNSSWTLKAELTFDYVCRLLDYMEQHGHDSVYPYRDPGLPRESIVALNSGYILRKLDQLPAQGSEFPWCNKDLYMQDIFAIKHSKLIDGVLRFDENGPLTEFHRPDSPESDLSQVVLQDQQATPREQKSAHSTQTKSATSPA